MTRSLNCKSLDKVFLATSKNQENNKLAELAKEYGWNIFRGDEEDVLSRFVDISRNEEADLVARINADNFAIDPDVISHAIEELINNKLDVCSPFINNTYPFGSGAEVSTAECLLRIDKDTEGKNGRFREHIYSYAYENPEKYRIGFLEAPENLNRPYINISVDTEESYKSMCSIYRQFEGRESSYTLEEIINAWDSLMDGKFQF